MEKWRELLRSRKFWAALVALAVIIARAFRAELPISESELTGIVVVLASYIVGTGLENRGAARGGNIITAGAGAENGPQDGPQ
jgi:hypothetical protein